MSAIATVEPTRFQAGDTLRFNKTIDAYPGPTWILTYNLVSPVNPFQYIVTTSANATFEVNVPSAVTALYADGVYMMTGQVADGTDRYTIYQAEILITPNLGTSSNTDYRSFNQRMLALIDSMIEGAIPRRDISYSVNGRTFTAKNDMDLLKARDYFVAAVAQELSLGKNRRILTRFVRP